MHSPRALLFHEFDGASDPLKAIADHQQVHYLRGYLADLGASSIIEEQNYFDRDYLAEFSAFYGVSAAGYPNVCRRLHVFFGPAVLRQDVEVAASGDISAQKSLQSRYLGYIVLRPIPKAPLGRTVLAWYEDHTVMTPRVVSPSREYRCNLAGIVLKISGLAWQQQDTGVGACATVGLWTMFHSSAFDDHHAIPTTADITRSAHETASLGARVFPSDGLTPYQIAEAIKAWNLSPLIVEGDKRLEMGLTAFNPLRFSASIAAFIRSGYPVLLIGELAGNGLHAICTVGFRSSGNPPIDHDSTEVQDSWISHIYVHDDNVGPNVRLKITQGSEGEAVLTMDAPTASTARTGLSLPAISYADFVPSRMVVGVHVDLRTSAETLYSTALQTADWLRKAVNALTPEGVHPTGNTVSARFVRLSEYLNIELQKTLGATPDILSRVRLALVEQVRPMSLHIGLIRIGDANSAPIMDVLYDTTDSDLNHPVFANIAYSAVARFGHSFLMEALPRKFPLGVQIDAF
ncbi:hypothetical protein [Ferribacterium limneticum]|uniref:hypothetical protein n=1 Tax=Ferribacterium limneticum TaxID=76259 RepID=UPI001CFA661C|nr:hypothetical protein [Ferribacterium limneticum]UCV18639.1 hypothetical protein KI610_17895 [Ferribacterium limneticum]